MLKYLILKCGDLLRQHNIDMFVLYKHLEMAYKLTETPLKTIFIKKTCSCALFKYN